MSIFQTIIASAVGEVYTPPPTGYPAPGFGYPSGGGGISTPTIQRIPAGYYEASSLSNPIVGLWRRTYDGALLDGINVGVETFPTGFPEVESMLDVPVGFGYGLDVSTNFTMEWKGYFKPEANGDFVFTSSVDDYMFMWIGNPAVSGFTNNPSSYIIKENSGTDRIFMEAGRYYPVRIRYTENEGGNNCSIAFGLSGYSMYNNQLNGAIGQFYTDDNTNAGSYPPSGLIS
jgi:hypothetical protein